MRIFDRLPMILQTEAAECGLASLAMIANYYGHRIDMNNLRQRFALSLKGATLADLVGMADALDLSSRPVRAELEHLPFLSLPCILHWDLNHYVVLRETRGGKAIVHDPARGILTLPEAEVSKHFSGIALEIDRAPGFTPIKQKSTLGIADLWSRITGARRALLQTLSLSIILQAILLTMPLYLQFVIDRVLPAYDLDLLTVVALAFAGLLMLGGAAEALRSYIVLTMSQQMSLQLLGNILRHLMRLPTSFFEKRFVGDILSRMASIKPIQRLIAEGLVSTFIDGCIALVSLVVLFAYSLRLGLIVVGFMAIHMAISLGALMVRRPKEEELSVAQAEEQSHLIETIRANKPLKLFGRETEREGAWRNRYVRVSNSAMSVGKILVATKASQTLTDGLGLVLVVYFGARSVMADELTLGMLFAFLLFRTHLVDRANALVERYTDFRLMRVHLDRLADIVVSEPEREGIVPQVGKDEVRGRVTLQQVGFRYAMNEPSIFDGVTLDIEPGDFVAFVGPSGGGKSTLLKVILGLYPPTEGAILIDGRPLKNFGLRRWRSLLGVVQQDDELFAGTISENIAFFETDIDMDRVISCAKAALIHDDVMAMPMNYLSLVGDMGSTLSGGQRQRILLARALYRDPLILVLDEGTANLDPDTERSIADVLSNMSITRIVVAHRPELVQRANRVFRVEEGRVAQILCPVAA